MFLPRALLATSCFYLCIISWLPGLSATTCSSFLLLFHFFMKNDSISVNKFSHGLYFPIIVSSLDLSLTICKLSKFNCNGVFRRAEESNLEQIKIGFPSPLRSMVKMNIKKIYEDTKQIGDLLKPMRRKMK